MVLFRHYITTRKINLTFYYCGNFDKIIIINFSMLITPLAQLKLPNAAHFVRIRVTPDGKRIVAASCQGEISVIDENLRVILKYDTDFSIEDLSIHPSGEILAIKDKSSRLVVTQIDGKLLFESININYPHEYAWDCVFSADGTKLWEIGANADEQIQIQYREIENWQVLQQAIMPNCSSCSYFTLTSHPESQVISVWEGTGQCESSIYFVWDEDCEIRVLEAPHLDDPATPEFHPQGKEFLVKSDCNSQLHHYSFPYLHLMGSTDFEIEEDFFSYDYCYLSDNRAIAKSEEGRLFIIALDSMKIIDEVIIVGHELYAVDIQHDNYLSGDVSRLKPAGERIISVHTPHDYRKNECTLLVWSA